ncbi:MAG: glycosyltransferase family 2 protein [Candidatus Promineifilaceae bacterium]|jgi:glycosyltransferase involved in cell wall biosynthesis
MTAAMVQSERVMALIPAYNEEENIPTVVQGIRQVLPQADIVVIDDCSTDRTVEVARASRAVVVRLPSNLGIGGAVQTGLKFARAQGYDTIIRLDGDGQHDPQDIPALLAAIKSGKVDAVFGSRFMGKDSTMTIPISRRLGIKTFAFLVSILTRQKATDTTSGYMCLNRYAIDVLADYLPQDYPEVEGRVILHKAGLTTLELPAHMRSRMAGISSINGWRSIYYAVKVSIAALIGAMKEIPVVQKELDYDSHTAHPTAGRYRSQSYSAAGDHPADTEAQTT